MTKITLGTASISSVFATLLSNSAMAVDIPYSVGAGPYEHFDGVVHLTDSLQLDSVQGTASGVANGSYYLNSSQTHSEVYGPGFKVNINLDFAPQRLSARVDTCPIDPNTCDAGSWVIIWQQ